MNPYMTQTEIEARMGEQAARIGRPDLFRKALRLDNPAMLGRFTGDLDEVKAGHLLAPGESL